MDQSLRRDLRRFLAEDIGRGDITSALLSPGRIKASVIAREGCTVSGARHARELFIMGGCSARVCVGDGRSARRGNIIMDVAGPARAVLSTERTALNLMSRMSGIATMTARMVRKVGRKTAIYSTRKTAPGLRRFDKEAVVAGGGHAHRMSLDEAVLIKDNHIAAGGSMEDLIRAARRKHRRIEVEVEDIGAAVLAADCGADVILLDNFAPRQAARAVSELRRRRPRPRIEISGGITVQNIARYAGIGADMISVGSLTHSVRGIDYSLDVTG
ncbi:nicotinate-nucleotide pyrophosphorylase (carboxylating) [Cenarchaeum symbiosum A]|uniref:Nicotinate-nucleotide pyrophosphorylase [carboxylating] n=1 Tax=Cenarchaeum symbiosum (strain A) TaxID=414004 RepID=A0RW76_CENSY|nr:nicotinate-nucleotide pyrophosphorylase (carboxylating) [Cenarchaeum symbiosum A]